MKVRGVAANHRKKAFEVRLSSRTMIYPFAKLDPRPGPEDRVARWFVDEEIGREGFTYVLESGKEGTVHVDQVLEYNRDPVFLRDALLYRLTLEALKRIESSPLSQREITRRLGTSATQFYRLLDPTNRRKSVDKMLSLLSVLDCDVDLVVRAKTA
jgi:predicted XRE-type DNA-binding protein